VDRSTTALAEAAGWLREVFAGRPPEWAKTER
jgi:hypothetical protein